MCAAIFDQKGSSGKTSSAQILKSICCDRKDDQPQP